ncbi:MAG: DNA repair protein rad16 [Bogoriella megaspora]|nr:MAG: DNA repair protein rad16 [Bogoriella megaspora]
MGRSKRPSTSALPRKDLTNIANGGPSVSTSRRSSRRTLEAVAIPTVDSEPSQPDSKRKSSCSTSSLSSVKSSTRDNSMDYETPETSTAGTPGYSAPWKGKGRMTDPLSKATEPLSGAKDGKRKRDTLVVADSEDEDAAIENARISYDEEYARKLQKEEYENSEAEEPVMKKSKRSSSRFDIATFPPEDEDDSGDDTPLIISSRKKGTASSTTSRGTLNKKKNKISKAGSSRVGAALKTPHRPSRAASSNAQKAISTAQPIILDSEESALSELPDTEDSFSVTSSMANDDDGMESVDEENGDGQVTTSVSNRARNRTIQARIRRNNRVQRSQDILLETMSRKALRERKKLEEAHPEIKTMWTDLEKSPIIETEQARQPESISRKLKSFQLEGLNWMIKQEQTQYKGGLLGDEMGMGKTIQAVSLIMSDYPAKKPTLVVVPPVALMQWSNEIKDYTDGKLKIVVYHRQDSKVKDMKVKELVKNDIIMISYNSLESLYRKEVKGWNRGEDLVKEDSPIHAIDFHRLILDEAHSIKQRTTGVARACFALKGTYKWCLSGTPVQNRIGEFFSLLRFLEVRPFADYFCKRCSCSQLHWSVGADHKCEFCNHAQIEHVSVFNQEILNPITTSERPELRQSAMDKLHLITSRVMLRRMKRDHTASMELPPKEIVIHNEFFGEIERDFSSSIMSNTTRQFDTYVSRGVMLNNYANIFGLIMQMRQVANHPDLLLKKNAAEGQNVLVCNICDEPAEDAIRSKCKHEFCRSCVKNYVKSCEGAGGDPDCPRCHLPLTIDFDQPEIEQDEEQVKRSSIINRIKMENWTSSTKIEMLVYDLYKLRSKKQTVKSIVFSQFTSMLQLIEWRLRRAGFNTVMLDGSMSPIQRQKSIEYFMTNPDVEVFLVSLKAGGVALNLTEASRVFIVDPWWNPAAEWQSADRCHRIGQKRPCVITRLCIEDSVESRMVMLQEKKANMINGTINNDKVAMEKLTPEDMQFLFRGS